MAGEAVGRIALVCPSAAPVRCGVADYAGRLADALAAAGADVCLVERGWTAGALGIRPRDLAGFAAVHLQYPAIGFGRSLGPHFLPMLLAVPVIVTLHEFSLAHRARQLASGLFSLGRHRLVFTTAAERSAFRRTFPWWRGEAPVVPIGSNILFLPHDPDPEPTVAFFGHLKPNRCLDQFLDVAVLAVASGRPWRFEIIGAPAPGQEAYVDGLRKRAQTLPVVWSLDLEPRPVAERLARSAIAYLPFPDGASPRRGSLLAALGNGVPVITTPGPLCPPTLAAAVRFASGARSVLDEIDRLLAHPAPYRSLSLAGRTYAERFRWSSIAAAHLDLYRAILAGPAPVPARLAAAGP